MTLKTPRNGEQRTEAAAYIASLTGELASIARRNGLSTLGYLLEMARLEAEQAARLNGGAGN